jgi:nucleotide-binding universal stress UspA family protein
MSYKTILVHLCHSDKTRNRIDIAIELAKRSDAHLLGISTVGSLVFSELAQPGFYVNDQLITETLDSLVKNARLAADQFKAHILTARHHNFDVRICNGDAALCMEQLSRFSDLVIVGQSDKAEVSPSAPDNLPESIALGSAKPVLVIPYIGAGSAIGQRILVLWNGQREALRAVNHALPLLKGAKQVDVVTFNTDDCAEADPSSLALYLARHGVEVSISRESSIGIDVANAALSRACDLASDMIVMGCYGHSRVREWVFGGVTRHILKHMTVPVLMAH